jgi:hypothetical protein
MISFLVKLVNVVSFALNFAALETTKGIRWPHLVVMIANICAIFAINIIEFRKMRKEKTQCSKF